MDITIIYGGNGLADDISLAAVKRIHMVLKELEVNVKEHHLKDGASTDVLLQDIKNSQGVILATTVEWLGIGGLMQTFLDRCYHKQEKATFAGKYLMAVTLTSVTGEREANVYLEKAWHMLGGSEGIQLYGYIEKFVDLETDETIKSIVDKKTEDFYRVINQKRKKLPLSIHTRGQVAVSLQQGQAQTNLFNQVVGDHTPLNRREEEEDPIRKKQKQDIMELADLFKNKLQSETVQTGGSANHYLAKLEKAYQCHDSNLNCTYNICLTDRRDQDMILKIVGGVLTTSMGREQGAQVVMDMNVSTLEDILAGKLTAQRGFLTGGLKAKGNFTLLYEFDHLFALQR